MTRAVQIAELGDQNVFTIDSSNNRVGIGSTQPTEKLDVDGAIRVGTGITIDSVSGIISATGVNVTGVVTAAKFIGPMEGTVTGNISGTSGGLSGSPDITITNLTGVAGTFTGFVAFSTSISVGGTITYEDVQNVDSIGVVTARNGVKTNVSPAITIRDGTTEKGYIGFNGNDPFIGRKDGVGLSFQNNKVRPIDGDDGSPSNNTVDIGEPTYKFKDGYFAGTINVADINATGIVTSNSLDAAISFWTLGASGSDHYTFTGPGDLSSDTDPELQLIRGQKYIFKNRSGGHPFRIQSTPNGSTGTQYNDGVTNNDAGNGIDLIFDVPFDAPSILYYQCTSHGSMGGPIYIGSSSGDEVKLSGGVAFDNLLRESAKITAGKLSDNTNIDLENGMVHLFTTTETTTSTPNLRYNSSTTLNSKMAIGEVISVTLITTAAAAGYSAQLTIDGSAVTENWTGGSAPSDGGSSGVDIYAYTIIKTANATFTVIANQTKTS